MYYYYYFWYKRGSKTQKKTKKLAEHSKTWKRRRCHIKEVYGAHWTDSPF